MIRRAAYTLVMLGVPRVALACPVCFGQNDSPLASAINLGVMIMLGVVAGVLACFASFIVYLIRRARLVEETGGAAVPPPDPADAGRYVRSEPQEGTAQC